MANPVITQYLSDTSIPAEKRRNIANKLNSGAMDEMTAVKGITTKYGDKYGSVSETVSAKKDDIVGGFAKGLLGAAKPGQLMQGASDMATKAAPGMLRGLADYGSQMTQEQKNEAAQGSKMRASEEQKNIEAERSSLRELNRLGISPDVNATQQEKERTLRGVSPGSDLPAIWEPGAVESISNSPLANLGKSIYGSTVEPVGQMNLGMYGTVQAGAKGALAQVSELLKSGDWEKAQMLADKAMAEPVMYGEDNINWFRGENGQLDRLKSATNIATEGIRGASGAVNTASFVSPKLATNVGVQTLAGGSMGFSDAMREGKNPLEIAFDTGISAGLQGGLTAILGKIAGKAPKTEQEAKTMLKNTALKKGVKEQYANMLGKASKKERKVAQDYLEAGLNKLENWDSADDVYRYATKESGLDDFIKNIDDVKASLGKDVGKAKTGLSNVTVGDDVLRSQRSNVDDILKRYNIKQNPINEQAEKGVLNFPDSDLSLVPKKTQNKISDLFNAVRKGKDLNARDLESITSQIDQTTGLLRGRNLKAGDSSIDALMDVKKIVNNIVQKSDDAFGKANPRYAEFIQDYNNVKNAGKVSLPNKDEIFSGSQILKRSLTTGDEKYNAAIRSMNKLAKKYNITPPKDLPLRARLADMAETFTGTQQPRSFGGEIAEGAEALSGKAAMLIKGAKKVKQLATREIPKPLQEQTKMLQDLIVESLKTAETTGQKNIIMPKAVGPTLIGIMSLVHGN